MRNATISAVIAGLLCAAAALHAQVNGNSTISSTVLGQPLSITTSSQYAGAISSIKWAGKEFVNDWDHGRQVQTAASFFNRFECYNAYEAGSKPDGHGPTSTSKLLSLTASGNTLESNTQMAWYTLAHEPIPGFGDLCGDPANWLPCPQYNGPLSDYKIHKTVRIGFNGIPNVIEYNTDLFIPEVAREGELQTVVAVLNYEFANVFTYDHVSKNYRRIRAVGGEDDSIKVLATADGAYAMGYYSPELLQPYGDGGNGGYRWGLALPDPGFPDADFPCAGFGGVARFDLFNGPGTRSDRSYLVIGSMEQVKTGLNSLHAQFRPLDPDVFNWRDYVTMNGLQSVAPDLNTAEAHWLNTGIPQGKLASKFFSAPQYLQLNPDVANIFGATNYSAAIDHYVNFGRSEGRGTVAKPAAGMQHLLVTTNRNVTASGQNLFGQLGAPVLTAPPIGVHSLDNSVTEVAGGDYTSFAVKNDGTLWVWGSNQYGARGDGSAGNTLSDPVQVPLPVQVATPLRPGKHAVAVGTGVYAIIDREGRVWTWGVNWNGRLGDGTTTSRFTPAPVKKSSAPNDYLTGIVTIAAGGGTVAAIDADGTIWTWGAGANGALGNGSTEDKSYPSQVVAPHGPDQYAPLVGVTQIACGSSGFCITLGRAGNVYGWGNNSFSQLGTAPGGFAAVATLIPVGPSIDAIAAGSSHAIAHSANGNVFGWGYNGRGQLGTGSVSVAQFPPTAMSVGPSGMSDISDLVAGPNFSVMIRNSDRAVFVTGDNQWGQLAIPGNPPIQKLPVRSSF